MPNPDREFWLPVNGYEGLYKVSSLGRVYSARVGRMLSPSKAGHRIYPRVSLSKNGVSKGFSVHRLVLETFVGPCPEGCNASHLDGNSGNNALSNLAWETFKENQLRRREHGTNPAGERSTGKKLTKEAVLEIREAKQTRGRYWGCAEFAKKYGVRKDTISNAASGRTWWDLRPRAYLAQTDGKGE